MSNAQPYEWSHVVFLVANSGGMFRVALLVRLFALDPGGWIDIGVTGVFELSVCLCSCRLRYWDLRVREIGWEMNGISVCPFSS